MRGPSILRAGAVAAAAFAALFAVRAMGQHPPFEGPPPRALHEQLAGADEVGIASVHGVDPGRIRMIDARGVSGTLPEKLQLKRAPSTPPPLTPGDRAVLLLRGARSPYLLASEPAEVIVLDEADQEVAWASGLRALRAAGVDGEAIARAYASWLDASPRMQREAAIGLAHEDCPASALGVELVRQLADRALESDDAELRRAAARAAVRSAEGRSLLLERLPSNDPQVLVTALSVGGVESAAARDTVLRALRHEDARIRSAALRFTFGFANDRGVRAQLVRIASEDPEARLRDQARRIMKRSAD